MTNHHAHTHTHTGFCTVARTQEDTYQYIFRGPEKSPRKKMSSHVWSMARKCPPPKWGLTTHKLSNLRVVTCTVEHTLQEQCSLPRTSLKLTETCIPMTLKTAVLPDFPRTRKRSSQEKMSLQVWSRARKCPPSEVSQTHIHWSNSKTLCVYCMFNTEIQSKSERLRNNTLNYPVHYPVACCQKQNRISKTAGYPANRNWNWISDASVLDRNIPHRVHSTQYTVHSTSGGTGQNMLNTRQLTFSKNLVSENVPVWKTDRPWCWPVHWTHNKPSSDSHSTHTFTDTLAGGQSRL